MKSVIYDFETLHTNPLIGVVVSLAYLEFDESRFIDSPYSYDELVNLCGMVKFDVEEQVTKYNRKISKDTIEWWMKQDKEARKMLEPSDQDISIDHLFQLLRHINIQDADKVYTRGNTFDPVFILSILNSMGKDDPVPYWKMRDTRSLIDGMTYGHDISNKFVPDDVKDKFIAHDPRHDVAMDVYRIQYLARLLYD